jgi:hypothetical protein
MDVGEGLLFKKPMSTITNTIKANPKASVKFMDKRLSSQQRFLKKGQTLKEQQQALGEFQSIMTDPYSNPHLYMALDKSNRTVNTSRWNPTFNENFYSNLTDKGVKTGVAANELEFGGLRYDEGGIKEVEDKDKKKNKGTNIKVLQNFLIKKGYDLGAGEGKPITRGVGVFGPKTKAALESYNKSQNLREVGENLTGVDPFAGFPLPVRELMKSSLLPDFMYKMTGDFSDNDMNSRQLNALAKTVDDALKRGKNQIAYSEKDDEGNIKPNVHAWDNKGYKDLGNTSTWGDLAQMLYNPTYNNKTTFGTTNIIETPEYIDSEGNTVPSQRWVNDVYDFNDAEKSQRKNSFVGKWKDILGAKSPYSKVRAFARNYSNPEGRNMMVRVQEEGGLRKKKKKARSLREYAHYVKGQEEGSKSTHLMKWYDKTDKGYPVAPSITTDKENYYPQSYDQALDRDEVFFFKTERAAKKFSAGNWKKGKDKREAMRKWRKKGRP